MRLYQTLSTNNRSTKTQISQTSCSWGGVESERDDGGERGRGDRETISKLTWSINILFKSKLDALLKVLKNPFKLFGNID